MSNAFGSYSNFSSLGAASRPGSLGSSQHDSQQGDRPVSADADNQPERWKAALWRSGGWSRLGAIGGFPGEGDSAALEREESSCSAAEDARELEHVVSLLGFGRFQEQSLLILACMQMVDGMEATLWWTFEDVMRERWQVAHTEYRVGYCIAGACLAVGSYFGGKLADEHGRHFVLFFSGAAYICASFLSCFSFNKWCLLVLRSLSSVALGCRLPATLALAVELLPCTWRARGALLLPGVGATLGSVLVLVVWELARWQGLDAVEHGWRLVLASCLTMDGIVFYYFRNNMAESPFYLRQQGRMRECRALLTEIAEINDCVLPDDDVPISRQVSGPDAAAAEALGAALARTGRVSVLLWVASALGSTIVISELVEDEGVVYNRVGSLGSTQQGCQVALLYIFAAYCSLMILELPRTGFRGSLLMVLVPSCVVSVSLALVPPSQGTAAFLVAVWYRAAWDTAMREGGEGIERGDRLYIEVL